MQNTSAFLFIKEGSLYYFDETPQRYKMFSKSDEK
jgi:hypothetical protein